MSSPWCPIIEHVTAEEPWLCGTCGEHWCHLCDDSTRFDEVGEHICEGCAPPRLSLGVEAAREARMDRLIADMEDEDSPAAAPGVAQQQPLA